MKKAAQRKGSVSALPSLKQKKHHVKLTKGQKSSIAGKAQLPVASGKPADHSKDSKLGNKLKRKKKKEKDTVKKEVTEDASSCQALTTEWINEQRVLIFGSRGLSCLARHVMKNLLSLFPHSRSENKLDVKRNFDVVMVETMEDRKCNKVLFFEMRKKRDLYMYAAAGPDGPTVKFHVQNLHSMEELRLTGNCLRNSRPLLSFDKRFEQKDEPHLALIKELFTQCFGCPRNHPRSQPFIDHVFAFSLIDDRIWFRNYQIVDSKKGKMAEIGPRFCLQPIYIQQGLFGGTLIYKNKNYVSPNLIRRMRRLQQSHKGRMYGQRVLEQVDREERVPLDLPAYARNLADPIFEG